MADDTQGFQLTFPNTLYDNTKYKSFRIDFVTQNKMSDDIKALAKSASSTAAMDFSSTTIGDEASITAKAKDNMSKAGTTITNILKGNSPETVGSTLYKDAKLIGSIHMPIPNQLTDGYTHQWSQKSTLLKGMLGGIEESMFGKAYAGYADDQNVAKAIINPGLYQDYSGTTPRTFDFSFDLVANNMKEFQTIMAIIVRLKKYSAPKMISGVPVLMSPNFFRISFGNPYLTNMINPRACVLQSISTNYSPSGFVETTYGGAPKAISLNLTFIEKEIVTFDDWANI